MHHTIRLSQMRIGVDLDGVVADFTHGWTSQYKKDFGKDILEKDITEWGLSKPLTHFEEEIDFWNLKKNISLILKIPPVTTIPCLHNSFSCFCWNPFCRSRSTYSQKYI